MNSAFDAPASAAAAAFPPADDAALAARLDRVLGAALGERRIVGAVALVARHGRLVYRRAHGLAERETQRPMREDTLFRLSSITKPIVTVAVLRLVADGRMALDAPITRWLPDFAPALPDGRAPALSVHQLLTHTAGLSYWLLEAPGSAYHTLGVSDGIDLVDFDLAENLRRIAAAPLAFEPGSAWRYSLALDVLGAAIERETGRALPDAVARLVTTPLGMRDTGFVAADPARFAVAYANAAPEPARITDNLDVPLPEGHGVRCASRRRGCSTRRRSRRAARGCTAAPTTCCACSRRSARAATVSCRPRSSPRCAPITRGRPPARAGPAGASAMAERCCPIRRSRSRRRAPEPCNGAASTGIRGSSTRRAGSPCC
ncbi:hypothetical protein NCR_03773 [Burkholderia pseudomallei]